MRNGYFENSIEGISDWLLQILTRWGVSSEWVQYLNLIIMLGCAIIVLYLTLYISKNLVRWMLNKMAGPVKTPFLHYLASNKFPQNLSWLIFYAVAKAFVPVVFWGFPRLTKFFSVLVEVSLVFIIISIITSFIAAVFNLLRARPIYSQKPLNSYLQVIKIILYLLGAVVIFSIITGKSPNVFFGIMGAASALLLLMFKDSIMGFVASIQVTTNDMVRLDDWITIPKYGADGNVIEINLTTVKVQNFDKTITTIPTYALISDSFQNWRGMQDSGGRRIKRALKIKQDSVKYLEDADLEKFRKIQGIAQYIDERQIEINEHNESIRADKSVKINGRNLTNCGLFRKYVEWYLRNYPGINKNMLLMVRQLPPSEKGLPIEIYAFTETTDWEEYEIIIADIFDHLIASVKYFDLFIFEDKSSTDIIQIENPL